MTIWRTVHSHPFAQSNRIRTAVVLCLLVLVGFFAISIIPVGGAVTDLNDEDGTEAQSVTTLTSCTQITEPGVYVLEDDLISDDVNEYCLEIDASDVVLDGQGNELRTVGTLLEDIDHANGIDITDGQSNVTIENVRFQDLEYGIRTSNAVDLTIRNNTFGEPSSPGGQREAIRFTDDLTDVTIEGNVIDGWANGIISDSFREYEINGLHIVENRFQNMDNRPISDASIFLDTHDPVEDVVIEHNEFIDGDLRGIEIDDTDNVIIRNNDHLGVGASWTVLIVSSDNVEVRNETIDKEFAGAISAIRITGSSTNTIVADTEITRLSNQFTNSGAGIDIGSSAENTQLRRNTLTQLDFGVVDEGTDTVIEDTVIAETTGPGDEPFQQSGIRVRNAADGTVVTNTTIDGLRIAGTLENTELNEYADAFDDASQFAELEEPLERPAYDSLGLYVNVSQTDTFVSGAWADLELSYAGTTVDTIDEETLRVLVYDHAFERWEPAPAPNEADTVGQSVSANITDMGTVGVFAVDDAAFSYDGFDVTPNELIFDSGDSETVEIPGEVTNVGSEAGDYDLEVLVDGEVVTTDTGTLEVGESADVASTHTFEEEGTYTVTVAADGETILEQEVVVEFATVDISVVDGTVLGFGDITFGNDVIIRGDLENEGNVEGTYSVDLRVNDEVVDTQNATVGPDTVSQEAVEFRWTADEAGETDFALNDFHVDTRTVSDPEADFEFVNATLVDPVIDPGEEAEVITYVENVGTATGTETFSLMTYGPDNEYLELTNETVELDAGEVAPVTLTAPFDEEGEFELWVQDSEGSFMYTDPSTLTVAEVEIQVTDISHPDGFVTEFTAGSPTEFIVTVENTGDVEGTETVSFEIDGETEAQQEITVPGGTEETLRFDWTFDRGGQFDVSADGVEYEANPVTVIDRDLEIVSASLESTEIDTGERAVVNADVENTGSVESTVVLQAMGEIPGSFPEATATISPGETDTVVLESEPINVPIDDAPIFVNYGEQSVGAGLLTVGGEVLESSFIVGDLEVTPLTVAEGGEVTVTATVENVGDGTGSAPVALEIEGESVDSQEITVEAGASETASFTHTFDQPGEYDVTITSELADEVTTDTQTVTVEAFDGEIAVDRETGFAGLTTFEFSVENQTSVTNPDRYEWAFGDGETGETMAAEANHTYDEPGEYTPIVRGFDGDDLLFESALTVAVQQADAGLEAEPETADVNVTEVAFSLSGVPAEFDPDEYRWDFNDTGTDMVTSEPSTTHTYDELLGETVVSVELYSDGEYLFDGDTTVDVVDRIDPVVRVSLDDGVMAGEPVTVDASASTDNHRIASYTFETDEETITTDEPIQDLVFLESGEQSVTVTVEDESGNTNSTTQTVTIADAPELTVEVDAADEQLLRDGTADVTVSNDGQIPASNVTLKFEGTPTTGWSSTTVTIAELELESLEPDESVTETVAFSDSDPVGEYDTFVGWAKDNMRTSQPDVDLTATVDPGGASQATAERTTAVTFSDLRLVMTGPRTGIVDEPHEYQVRVVNRGTAPTPAYDATVDFDDGETETISVDPVDEGSTERTFVTHAYSDTDQFTGTVSIPDAPNQPSASHRVSIASLDVTFGTLNAPESVERTDRFYVTTWTNANAQGNLTTTIDAPEGLEVVGETERTHTNRQRAYNRWTVIADNESGSEPYEIDITGEVTRGSSDASVIETVSVNVTPRTTVIQNATGIPVSSADLDPDRADEFDPADYPDLELDIDEDDIEGGASASGTIHVPGDGVTTFDQDFGFTPQSGAAGRQLSGLADLNKYPHGCLEQTTSPLLAALNIENYYVAGGSAFGSALNAGSGSAAHLSVQGDVTTSSADFDSDAINASIDRGLERLATGSNAQHDDGSWSMWGNNPGSSNTFFTAYALSATGSAADSPVQSERSSVQTELNAVDTTAAVEWLADNQQEDGKFAGGRYLNDDDEMTGFTLVALERADLAPEDEAIADEIRENATAYLLDSQEADGSWSNGDVQPTALALWGLAITAEEGDTDAQDAIAHGVAWLEDTQDDDGSWSNNNEANGYALLALNEAAEDGTSGAIVSATSYLTEYYEDSQTSLGSYLGWGNTRANAVVIEALSTVDPDEGSLHVGTITFENAAGEEITVSEGDDETAVSQQFLVTDEEPRIALDLEPAELEALRAAGPEITVSVEAYGYGTMLLTIENEQVVDADEYEAVIGGGS